MLRPVFLGGAAVGRKAAYREHFRAPGILQPVERAQPPQQFVVVINDYVPHVQVFLRHGVFMVAQHTPVRYLVVEVVRAGLVAQEHDVRLARIRQLPVPVHGPARRKGQQHVRVALQGLVYGGLVPGRDDGQHFDREFCAPRQFPEFLFDSRRFLCRRFVREDFAVATPARALSRLRRLIAKHRLNPQRLPRRRLRVRETGPRFAGSAGRGQHHGRGDARSHSRQEASAAQSTLMCVFVHGPRPLMCSPCFSKGLPTSAVKPRPYRQHPVVRGVPATAHLRCSGQTGPHGRSATRRTGWHDRAPEVAGGHRPM